MSQYAPSLYRALNGVFCIYKPVGQTIQQTMHAIKTNLTREMVGQEGRPVRNRVVLASPGSNLDLLAGDGTRKMVDVVENHTNTLREDSGDKLAANNINAAFEVAHYGSAGLPTLQLVPDYSDHPLVVGPRYMYEDFDLQSVGHLAKESSGILVLAIGRGHSMVKPLAFARYLRVYHVRGELGMATQDFSPLGKIIERTTYHHVTQPRLDRVVGAMQAGHQRHMYQSAGVDVQSQEAYELACQGLIRPTDHKSGPVIYSIKCIEFKPPHFTLEIHAINETCVYLMKLMHEIGLEVRSTAVCTSVRRIRYGHFTLDHAMLLKHCSAQSIIDNIRFCAPLLRDETLRCPKTISNTDRIALA